ncbi:hypothetical protein [Mastigocoleus testarum]|uniref:Glutamate--cysteine ligase n=1 Tax=Mastigocoleus testarum BC008 TaxID=371196 RepID=A0A0V8A190_9CYAN|nr:hypothetical protein [Mastigocoleus testarum]KST70399.1 glutamate--cysteine ligase [Mastigocoleus testarum BC008]
MFLFGIEHEVAFLNHRGKFADFSCTSFKDFSPIIDMLPSYPGDYSQLRIGDAGIKKKRWYIEGFERFANSEKVIECVPKGIEIRTSIHHDISSTIAELSESFLLLRQAASFLGFSPVLASFNPYLTVFEPLPPLNDYELKRRNHYSRKQTLNIPMLSYGADLNISVAGLSQEELIDMGRKLTYYSPYIIPFSFSSPFYQGGIWEGLSARTFFRSEEKLPVMVFVNREEQLASSFPDFTRMARIPAEVSRIEFKACDCCDDFSIYAGLLALLKGLILDQSLDGRADFPDKALHQLSAKEGFDNLDIYGNAKELLSAAEDALDLDPDVELLTPLKVILEQRESAAHELLWVLEKVGSIEEVLKHTYIAYDMTNLN